MRKYFTSESVTEGHPDKVCDRISDSILDALLEADPQSRVAVETMVTTGLVHVAGEVSTMLMLKFRRLFANRSSRSATTHPARDLTVPPAVFPCLLVPKAVISQMAWIIPWRRVTVQMRIVVRLRARATRA